MASDFSPVRDTKDFCHDPRPSTPLQHLQPTFAVNMHEADMPKPLKSKLEKYIKSRPTAEENPGYFDDAGNFVRGPFYRAKLGGEYVGMVGSEGYDRQSGCYRTRQQAVAGAKLCKEKAQEWINEGNFQDD